MSTSTILIVLGLAITFLSTIVVPMIITRRSEHRADAKAAKKEAERVAAGTEVNWERINGAIVRERDRLEEDLQEVQERYEKQLAEMRKQHGAEIAAIRRQWAEDIDRLRTAMDAERTELKARYDEEIAELRTALNSCQQKVRDLSVELWELQRKLPPAP